MTLWIVASIVVLATIFWLNAIIMATPYIDYLFGLKKQSANKKSAIVALLLLFAGTLYFFLKVGSFAGEGLAGIVDPTYIRFIWEGPIGQFVQWQGIVACLWLIYPLLVPTRIKWVAYALVVALMGMSFLNMGHGSDAVWWGKLALLTHLLIAWLWFGSLNSLRKLATSAPLTNTQWIMQRFGAHMSVAVPVLLIAGLVMYRSATGQWVPDLPLVSYDIVLLTKLGLVACIMLVAALHKLKLVPELDNELAAKRLKKSITVEMGLAFAIFIMASALSSAFSPS